MARLAHTSQRRGTTVRTTPPEERGRACPPPSACPLFIRKGWVPMSRFLFATMPIVGHVAPIAPVARKLINRGHEVT